MQFAEAAAAIAATLQHQIMIFQYLEELPEVKHVTEVEVVDMEEVEARIKTQKTARNLLWQARRILKRVSSKRSE